MAAYPSAADYDAYDEPGPTPRRKKRAVPSLPTPSTPDLNVPGPPAPGSSNQPPGQPLFGVGPLPQPASAGDISGAAIPGPSTPTFPVPPRTETKVGVPTTGLNKTGRMLAGIEAMRDFDPASRIHETDWGHEVEPPERSPSRLRQALMGALQGALAGASKTGTLAGILGGAATGTAAGAVSPRMMLALKRDQDIRRTQGQVHDDLGLQKEIAQIGGIQSQQIENLAQAEEARAKANMAQAGEYTDPDTGEIIRTTPAEAARMRQRDRQEAGRDKRGNRSRSSGAQEAMAAEGAAAESAAIEGQQGVPDAITKWNADNEKDRTWIAERDKEWMNAANEQWRAAVAKWSENGGEALGTPRPRLKDYLDGVRSGDARFADYERTKENIKQRETDIKNLEGELKGLKKEERTGRAKSARSTATSTSRQKGSDGKWHYTLADVKKAAGDNWEKVLADLQKRDDVVIDQ